MAPRFWQCLNPQCGRTFQGEERGNPECPSCGSVRVTHAKIPPSSLMSRVSERGHVTSSPPPLAIKAEPAQKARDTAERDVKSRGNGKNERTKPKPVRAAKPAGQTGVKLERPEGAPHTKATARRFGCDASEHHHDDDLAALSPAGRKTLRRVLASLSTAEPLGLLRAVRTGAAGLTVYNLEPGFDAAIALLQDVARDHYGLSVDDIKAQVAGGIQDVLDQRASSTKKKTKRTEATEASDADIIAELNREYCVVRDGGKTRVLSFERHEQKINNRFTHTRLVPMTASFDDFRNYHLNRKIAVKRGDQTILIPIGKRWLEHPDRRTYPGLVFEPAGGDIINGRLNLWRGWGVELKPGDWSLMNRHITEILASGVKEWADYILNWLAWTVQHPAERAEVALAFRGKRGTGRSTLGNTMVRIFGQHGGHISSARHITGNFNAHMRDCCFLFSDEAFWPGDHAAEGALKRLITEPDLAIEGKGKDIVWVPNMLHIIFASNDPWIIPAGEAERRFAGFDVPDIHMQDEAWFTPLYKQLESGGYGAMLYDLLRHPLDDFHPRRFPKTEMLLDQQTLSLSSEDKWWVELLETGILWGSTKNRPNLAASNEFEAEEEIRDGYGGFHIRRRRIKGIYDQAREISPGLRNESDHALGHFLGKMGCVNDNHCGPKRSKRGWKFPDLDSARTKWEERFPTWKWRNPDLAEWEASEDD
jgi:hypothetical protein